MIIEVRNLNPKGKKCGDCVVRAIALFTGKSWHKIYDDLCMLGYKECMMPNDQALYQKYLKKIGCIQFKQPKHSDGTKYTLQEFVDDYLPEGNTKYLVKLAHHLTVVSSGVIYDTWNCSYKTVGKWWKLPEPNSVDDIIKAINLSFDRILNDD